jgi:hypothetical protein
MNSLHLHLAALLRNATHPPPVGRLVPDAPLMFTSDPIAIELNCKNALRAWSVDPNRASVGRPPIRNTGFAD